MHMVPQQPMMVQQPMMMQQQPMMMQQQPMMMPPQQGYGGGGFAVPNQYNPWARPGINYQSMSGFHQVDYTGGWNPNIHDTMLRNNINKVFVRYDANRNGQLDGPEFFYAYRDLCLMMGLCPPQTQAEVWQAALSCDLNGDGMISRMELFILFKKLQGFSRMDPFQEFQQMQMQIKGNMGMWGGFF